MQQPWNDQGTGTERCKCYNQGQSRQNSTAILYGVGKCLPVHCKTSAVS